MIISYFVNHDTLVANTMGSATEFIFQLHNQPHRGKGRISNVGDYT